MFDENYMKKTVSGKVNKNLKTFKANTEEGGWPAMVFVHQESKYQ